MLESEPAVIFRFIYNETRELHEIKRVLFGVSSPFIIGQG